MRRFEGKILGALPDADAASPVSVVVIGLNEARHLPACFASLSASGLRPQEVLYVDSGSTDASTDVADCWHAKVLTLEGRPASAAAARNVGLAHARGEFLHFVDGDMTIDCEWLEAGHAALAANDSLACVFGPVAELGTSLADRIIGRDWSQRQPGAAEAPGSGGMFRTQLLREVGGYCEDLIAAEETELGRRLRAHGYGIYCLPTTMGYHELGLSGVKAYWSRWTRGGLARWQWNHSQTPTSADWIAAAKPFVMTGGALTTMMLLLGPRRLRFLGLLGALGFVGLVARLTIRATRRGEALPMAIASSVENYLRFPPSACGFAMAAARFTMERRRFPVESGRRLNRLRPWPPDVR